MPSDVQVHFLDKGYGKNFVKILIVKREGSVHSIQEYEVSTKLELDSVKDYECGDNTDVVATDTQKNTVYAVAKRIGVKCAETFGLDLCQHFLTTYSHVVRAKVHVRQAPWRRMRVGDKEHQHAFISSPEAVRFCDVEQRKHGSPVVWSGITDMKVLKTTQSAFRDFHRDEFRSLPDADERVFCTVVYAKWKYRSTQVDFCHAWSACQAAITDVFAGPADTGLFSPSVQQTMYDSCRQMLGRVPQITEVHMELPNVHNFAFDFSKLPELGIKENNTIFVPFDKPSGHIACTLQRTPTSRL